MAVSLRVDSDTAGEAERRVDFVVADFVVAGFEAAAGAAWYCFRPLSGFELRVMPVGSIAFVPGAAGAGESAGSADAAAAGGL